MTYPRAVAISWTLAALLLAFACQAFGGVFVEGQAGSSYMLNTAPDGLWQQQAFGTNYQGVKLAYGGRIGWRFEAPYSIQAGVVSFGTGRLTTPAVGDACYNALTHTVKCGDSAMYLRTANTMRGYTLSGTRYFSLSRDFSIPVSLGVALVTARLHTDSFFNPSANQDRYSRMPMGSVAVGLCYRETVCWDNTFYAALQGQNYHDPLSTQVITSLVGVRYAFQ